MTDQDARDLIATLPERLRSDASNLEGDITPGEANESVYRGRVAQLRADADALDRLLLERASLRAQIIDECARVAEEMEAPVPECCGRGGETCCGEAVPFYPIAHRIRSLSPPSPSTIEGEEGR